MTRAIWKDTIIAESDACIEVEGNAYFPEKDVRCDCLRENPLTTQCSWKGTANYYDIVVAGQTNEAAAWTYRDPKAAAAEITGRIAFWRGVRIER